MPAQILLVEAPFLQPGKGRTGEGKGSQSELGEADRSPTPTGFVSHRINSGPGPPFPKLPKEHEARVPGPRAEAGQGSCGGLDPAEVIQREHPARAPGGYSPHHLPWPISPAESPATGCQNHPGALGGARQVWEGEVCCAADGESTLGPHPPAIGTHSDAGCPAPAQTPQAPCVSKHSLLPGLIIVCNTCPGAEAHERYLPPPISSLPPTHTSLPPQEVTSWGWRLQAGSGEATPLH